MARKHKQKKEIDDTPRQFRRVMELQKRLSQPKKKPVQLSNTSASTPPVPKLERKRGESMADFSRRVDQAIPLPRARGVESRKTAKNAKKNRKTAENLRAEYHQKWEAKKRRLEDADDANDDLSVEDDGEDIWASVNAKSKKPKFGEVADRPPELPRLKQLNNVPKSAGSLYRREMLESERQRVIDTYRKLRGTNEVEE